MYKLLPCLWLGDIQWEEKNNGKLGLRISKTTESIKKTWLTPEFHMLQHFNFQRLLKVWEWQRWFQQQVTQHSHLNQQLTLQRCKFPLTFKLHQDLLLAIRLEEKNNGKHGLKTLKTMELIKKIWPTPEFPMLQLSNLHRLLRALEWQQWFQLPEILLFHHNQQLMLQRCKFLLTFKLHQAQLLAIQSEEKNNGRLGLKTLKIMAFNKRTLLIQESLMLQLSS